jgi:5-methylcytosine-specific restriction endonuclease McrA
MDWYTQYLTSDGWKARAFAAKRRAGFECALCEETHHLDVHHRNYRRVGFERPTDLIVLCRRCHQRHHGVLGSIRRAQVEPPPRQLLLPFVATLPAGPELN